MPGDGLAFTIRVSGEIQCIGLLHRLDDGIHVALVLLDQVVLHGEVIIGIDCALFRNQVTNMAIGSKRTEVLAEVLGHGFRFRW